jgi:signal transduction histidine kinase
MSRTAPVLLMAAGLTLLLGWYVFYTRDVVSQLQAEARSEGLMYARVWRALSDTSGEAAATAALLDLSRHIREKGVPVIVTDADGNPTAAANLPFDSLPDITDPRVREYIALLDAQNQPVVAADQSVHYGNTVLVRGLRVIPLVQTMFIVLVVGAGIYAVRQHGRAERERTWAGMAREAAHQLGTPLTSISGWLELMAERAGDPLMSTAISHMHGDLERLERVAHRFERIGHPPRTDDVDVGALAERVSSYFRQRVPTLAHTIVIRYQPPEHPLIVRGDAVLLEWALEAVVKNAIDVLAGRGGTVEVSVAPAAGDSVRIRVSDDGPGIPREHRSKVFEAGFTTKEQGWGVGLSLAKRIVERNHRGRLVLAQADRGARFDIILTR